MATQFQPAGAAGLPASRKKERLSNTTRPPYLATHPRDEQVGRIAPNISAVVDEAKRRAIDLIDRQPRRSAEEIAEAIAAQEAEIIRVHVEYELITHLRGVRGRNAL